MALQQEVVLSMGRAKPKSKSKSVYLALLLALSALLTLWELLSHGKS